MSVEVAKVTALEFLLYCQALGQVPTFYALVRWTQGDEECGEDDDRTGNREEVVPKE